MRQNSGIKNQYPGRYNHRRIIDEMSAKGLTPEMISKKSRKLGEYVSEDTIMRAQNGGCGTIKKLWAIATIVGIPFFELFIFDPPAH